MTKNDLKTLINIKEGKQELIIDKCRRLDYQVSVFGFTSTNEETNKKDILTLYFYNNLNYGDIPTSYKIESRDPAGILNEVKLNTEKYFNNCMEYLNGNKCLANNWN